MEVDGSSHMMSVEPTMDTLRKSVEYVGIIMGRYDEIFINSQFLHYGDITSFQLLK